MQVDSLTERSLEEDMTERLIVVGFDGSPQGERALEWALHHAATSGAAVEVVSAFTWDGPDWMYLDGRGGLESAVRAEQETGIQRALERIQVAPTVSRTVVEGGAIDVLIRAAAEADLLVLGSHGRNHLVTALLGSVSEGCIRHGTTPVLVIPDHEPPRQSADVIPASRSGSPSDALA